MPLSPYYGTVWTILRFETTHYLITMISNNGSENLCALALYMYSPLYVLQA